MQLLAYCPTSRTGVRIEMVNARKLMGWDTDSLREKAKPMPTGNTRNQSTASQGNAVVQPSPGERAPSHVTVTWEKKCYPSKCFHSSSFLSLLYILSMMSHGLEYPSRQLGWPVLVVSPPSLHAPTTSLLAWQVYEKQKSNICSMTAMQVGRSNTLCNCLFYSCGSTRGRTGIVGAFQVLHHRKAAFLSHCPMTEKSENSSAAINFWNGIKL